MPFQLKSLSHLCLTAAACVAMAVVADSNAQQPESMELFAEAGSPSFQPKLGREVVRSRMTRVDRPQLDSLRAGSSVKLRLRDDLVPDAVIDRIDRRQPDSYSLFGVLQGHPQSRVILVVDQDAVAGWILIPDRNLQYGLRWAGPDASVLCEINNGAMPGCHLAPGAAAAGAGARPQADPRRGMLADMLREAGVPGAAVSDLLDGLPTSSHADDAGAPEEEDDGGIAGGCSAPGTPILDVMVVYTAITRAAIGSVNATNAEVQLAVDVSNETYINSQSNLRMRLVYRAEVSYNEVGALNQHRDRLAGPADGVLDGIHATRDTYGADMVVMWVADNDPDANGDPTTCGIAYCTPAGSHEGFCIVVWDCAVSNYSHAHEIGHLLGSAHDPDNAGSGCNSFSYSYGHNWSIGGGLWRHTVMSYAPVNGSVRVPYWSNPNVSLNGHVTGTATRNNALSIAQTAPGRSSWRVSRHDVWVQFAFGGTQLGTFNNPFSTIAAAQAFMNQGVGAIDRPTMWIKSGSTSSSALFNESCHVRTCGGPVVIGLQ